MDLDEIQRIVGGEGVEMVTVTASGTEVKRRWGGGR